MEQEPTRSLHDPIYNELGVIAESYHELQGVGLLEAARQAYPLRKASNESTLRTVFQAAEVALLNLADLTARATVDLDQGRLSTAVVKMFWARGFHRLLTQLSLIPHKLGIVIGPTQESGKLCIRDSAAFNGYLSNLRRFDEKMIEQIESGVLNAEAVISERSLDYWEYNFFHLVRVCNHESTIWEHNLAQVLVPAPMPGYHEFVVSAGVREAVYDRTLKGDTYFTQFRGLHQIPEMLGAELNDRLELAIREIRADHLRRAIEELKCIDILSDVIAASVPPIVDNLATADYHVIRENLGLTSGSHSVCLRYHMFTHLYEDLCDELIKCAIRWSPQAKGDGVKALREVAVSGTEDWRGWLIQLIGDYCLKFSAFISEWRDQHIHLPRNNLGGVSTKSLTGSADAVKAVKGLRDGALFRDPIVALKEARSITEERVDKALAQYFDSQESLDWRLVALTGKITQRRFVQVQERLGFFANKCPFTPPPRRKP